VSSIDEARERARQTEEAAGNDNWGKDYDIAVKLFTGKIVPVKRPEAKETK